MQRMSGVVYRRFGTASQFHYQGPSSPKIMTKTSNKRRPKPQISHVFGATQKCLMLYSNLKVVWKGGGIDKVVWRKKRKYLAW